MSGSARPSAAEWQHAAEVGSRAVRQAMGDACEQLIGQNYILLHAAGWGALTSAAEFLRGVTEPNGWPALERLALGYVRAAIRGAHTPILDNGKPMERMTDA